MTNADPRFTPGARVRVIADDVSPENIGATGTVKSNRPFGLLDPFPIDVTFDVPRDRFAQPNRDVFHPSELEILP